MVHLDFLPSIVEFNGEWDEFLQITYEVFQHTIVRPHVVFNNKRVVFDSRLDEKGYSEGFWHVITQTDKSTGERLLDIPRAERITWIAPMIENAQIGPVHCWAEQVNVRKTKHHIWAERDKFVVVLEENPNVVVLITAFCVDIEWKEKDLRRKLKRSQR